MDLSVALLVLLIILFLGILALFFYFSKYLGQIRDHQLSNQQDRLLEMVDRNIQTNMTNMQQMIQETTSSLNIRLDKAAHVIGQVNKELGSMSEIGRNLKDFQAFLTAPKLRGNIGEQILYDAMSQVFSSNQYDTQFKFKDGQIVDAVIKTNEALIPIDSKFPMESFRLVCEASTDQEQDRKSVV